GIRDGHVTGVQTCALPIFRGGAEARELAHRPELAAVHRGIDAPREGVDAGIAEVARVVDVHVVGRVEGLVLDPRDRRKGLSLPRSEERRVGKECRSGWWAG